jgi:putative flippase GtrA
MRFSDPEFIRFLIAGVANTVLGYLLYLLFGLVMDYRLAYSCSYAAGIVLSYWINTAFVFRRAWDWRRLAAYPSVYLLQYLVGLALLFLLVEHAGVPEKLAPLLSIPMTIPITFLASRFIIKGRASEPKH